MRSKLGHQQKSTHSKLNGKVQYETHTEAGLKNTKEGDCSSQPANTTMHVLLQTYRGAPCPDYKGLH